MHADLKLVRRCRRGSVYLAVLGVTMIVGMMGFCSMQIARLHLGNTTAQNDSREARLLALSAIEDAMAVINSDTGWRTTYTNDVEYPLTPPPMGNGSFTWKLVDEGDADLADSATDSVRLTGLGRVGNAVHAQSVLLQPAGIGLSCLEVSFHSSDKVQNSAGAVATTDQIISSNNDIKANAAGSQINGDAWCTGGISGTITGQVDAFMAPPRAMPDATTVFDYYIANGTVINVGDLPTFGGNPAIQDQVLSATNNPFGAGQTNLAGIYVIDLQSSNLVIRNCRIVATVVILNATSVDITSDVNWAPAVANYPALLVEGDLTTQFDGTTTFNETTVSLNPVGTPYEGFEDADTSDTYPNIVKGLVYASGKFTVTSGSATFDGVVVAVGMTKFQSSIDLTYQSTFFDYPPPGFAAGPEVSISPRSWKRTPTP